MREMLIGAARTYYMGMINKHIANMEVILTNPVGIGEDAHQDIQAVIEIELGKIADYHDKLEMLQKFFPKPQEKQPVEEKKKDDKSS
tara:strand:+ start:1087 stop:1347 length:261 start_codon:yes stop_codon:yes gene_type:complete